VNTYFFFFQAEDGIRDATVTGVQTCALPILLTNRTSPGINWGGYPSRFSFGLFTDPPIQIADSGAMVIIDFDLGRSFYAVDPANAAAGFNYVGYMQVRNSAVTGSVSGTVMGQNAGPIADASIAL